MPFFNNLIVRVEIIEKKTSKKISVTFIQTNNETHCVLVPASKNVPLFFYEPNTTDMLTSKITEIEIHESDENAFEEWYERNMTADPLTNAKSPKYFAALGFGLRMSTYGDALVERPQRCETANSVTVRTIDKNYFFTKSTGKPLSINELMQFKDVKSGYNYFLNLLKKDDNFIVEYFLEASLIVSKEKFLCEPPYKNFSRSIQQIIELKTELEESLKKIDLKEKPSIEKYPKRTKKYQDRLSLLRKILPHYIFFILSKDHVDDHLLMLCHHLKGLNLMLIKNSMHGFYSVNNTMGIPSGSIPNSDYQHWEKSFIFLDGESFYALDLKKVENLLSNTEEAQKPTYVRGSLPTASSVECHNDRCSHRIPWNSSSGFFCSEIKSSDYPSPSMETSKGENIFEEALRAGNWYDEEDEALYLAQKKSLEEYYLSDSFKKFAQKSQNYNFSIQRIEGDGNCFFRSVIDQLQQRHPEILSEISELIGVSIHEIDHGTLRQLAIGALITLRNRSNNAEEFEENMRNYIHSHGRDRTWATGIIISAMANVLNIVLVQVNSTDHRPTVIIEGYRGILYLAYHFGLHFDSLRGTPEFTLSQMISEQQRQAAIPARISIIEAWNASYKLSSELDNDFFSMKIN